MKLCLSFLAALVLQAVNLAGQSHSHINAGAYSPDQDAQLYFVNGGLYATNSDFVLPLTQNTNNYSGAYRGVLSFTSLPATLDAGGPAFGHAGFGAYLELKVESLEGPPNATLSLWEEDDFGTPLVPKFSLTTGTTNGTNRFNLSESDASPGADPYGHVHGRSFVISAPGLYTLGMRIIDTSSNGAAGGPIHRPSELFHLYLQAGRTISIARIGAAVQITFPTERFRDHYIDAIDAIDSFSSTNWTPIFGPFSDTHTSIHRITNSSPAAPQQFYRLRVEPQ